MFGEIEGTSIEVLDERFRGCFALHVRVERLWTGARWSEGPAWFAAGRYLVWSDIPNNRVLRYDETSGQVSIFREPSHYANGNTVDNQGRLVTCEHGSRRITRTEFDGSITVLADRWQGKRFNSPNDIVVKSDNSIWFTDPSYGIETEYEGDRAVAELAARNVFRLDGSSGQLDVVASDFVQPNGLAFSPDESVLYIADTGFTHVENGPRHIRRFVVGSDGRSLRGGDVLATCETGWFDGFRVDRDGRIWTSAGLGVNCYAPEGTLIGRVHIPEIVANVTFGGAKRNRLFICGTTSLYSLFLMTTGVKLG